MKISRVYSSIAAAAFCLLLADTAKGDPTLRTLQLGSQAPTVATAGGLAYFPIALTRAGTGSLSVQISVTGLPAGATYSFVPPDLSFTGQSPNTKNAKILIQTTASTAPGSYPFTVSARHGSSHNVITVNGTLVIGQTPVVIAHPIFNVPVLQPGGMILLSGIATANQPLLVQATSDLSTGIWDTIDIQLPGNDGIFSLIDQDAPIFPMRFYRLVQ